MTNIRPANTNDLGQLPLTTAHKLTYSADIERYWIITPNSESSSFLSAESEKLKWLSELRSNDSFGIVATYDNKIMATGTLKLSKTHHSIKSTLVDFIICNKDINTASDMLKYLTTKAKNDKHESLTLTINKKDSMAIKLLQKYRFEELNVTENILENKAIYVLKIKSNTSISE